jgi:hypothetical protein
MLCNLKVKGPENKGPEEKEHLELCEPLQHADLLKKKKSRSLFAPVNKREYR